MGLPPMRIRGTHSPEFKASVAMEAITDCKTFQTIAVDGAERLMQLSQCKKQLLEGAKMFP
jgi:hypothetical protein